ncbi:hypothetical protein U1Q18_009807 [Sarracenia purpurea var. burkii]
MTKQTARASSAMDEPRSERDVTEMDLSSLDRGFGNALEVAIKHSISGVCPLSSGRQALIEARREALGSRSSSPSGLSGTETRKSPIRESQDPPAVDEIEDDVDQGGLDPDIDIPDLIVKSASYALDIANQSLRNALDVQAHHQAKERIVPQDTGVHLGVEPSGDDVEKRKSVGVAEGSI